jgi:hypothetical protein
MDYLDFMRQKLGKNWVLGCVTPKQLNAVEAEYREMYGDPHDAGRAAMWLCLKQIYARASNGDNCLTTISELARVALETERKQFTKEHK